MTLGEFIYNNNKIRTYSYGEHIYFCGKDIATVLGHYKTYNLIRSNICENKKSLRQIIKESDIIEPSLNNNDLIMVYINKDGLFELLSKSRMPNKNDFIKFCSEKYNFNYKIYTSLHKEQEYIGYLIKVFKHKSYRTQYCVNPYRIDLYFSDIKLVIECDEFDHANRDVEYELTRESYIKDILQCRFIRFNPDSEDFCIFDVINEIIKLM